MLKVGLATVYQGSFGVEFGGFEKEYREAEKKAKEKQIGMWAQPGLLKRLMTGQAETKIETPREFKTRTSAEAKDAMKRNSISTGKAA